MSIANSTRFLTHLAWHSKRGGDALEAIGIWPRYQGRFAGSAAISARCANKAMPGFTLSLRSLLETFSTSLERSK